MAEEPSMITVTDKDSILLMPNDSFRIYSQGILENGYFEIWKAISPLWCSLSSESSEWIPVPDGLNLEQRGVFLNGIRLRLLGMINDLTIGIGHAHISSADLLMDQWSGGFIMKHENKYTDDLQKLRESL